MQHPQPSSSFSAPSAPPLDDHDDPYRINNVNAMPPSLNAAQPILPPATNTSTSHRQSAGSMQYAAPGPQLSPSPAYAYQQTSVPPPYAAAPFMPQQPPQQPPQPLAMGMQVPQFSSPSLLRGGFEPVTPMQGGPYVAPMMPGAFAGASSNIHGGTGLPPTPSSIVDLHFRCKNLKTSDVFSESDPFLVVYVEHGRGSWRELGRTETVVNAANPTFTTTITVDYFFEEMQRVRLEVFDRDSPSQVLSKHDFLGCVEFTMAALMSSNGHALVLALLQSPAQRRTRGISGHVFVDAEEAAQCGDMVDVQFAGDKLDNKDGLFGKSDPFLNVYRMREDASDPSRVDAWIHVWRSSVVMNNLSPVWPSVSLSVRTLCNGDRSRMLKFECMDWEESGRHQLIGSTTVVAAEFVAGEKRAMDLINPERQRRKGKRYKNSGVLKIVSLASYKEHTFAEYLRGGCEISLMVGIDYTASNGFPSDPRSLHYLGGALYGQTNDYQSAIASTGAILEAYDHDKRFPVYGFGALVHGQVNHCFPLTFDPTSPEVERVAGILKAYGESLNVVQLHGPTYFAPLIRQAASIAKCFSQTGVPGQSSNLKYFVLLIITDGAIMDMDATIEEIVLASQLPLSIVIVGVGSADFSSMHQLDSDNKRLQSRSGHVAARDIVQFVPFNDFRANPSRLAKETLAEIPLQVTQHFRARGVAPKPPMARAPTDNLMAMATAQADSIYQRMQV